MSGTLPLTATDGSGRIGEELLLYLSRQGLKVPVPVLLTAVLIASMAHDAPHWMTLGWLALVALMLLIRGLTVRQMQRNTSLALNTRLSIVAAVAAASGVVHGMSVVFWPYFTELQRAIQTLVVIGLCAANVATSMGYPRSFVAYLIPTMTPTALSWAAALAPPGSPWYRGEASIVLILFIASASLLVVLARDTFRLFRESFDSRQRLRVALDQAEAANRAKTRFLASASHDLRQPMHTLSLFAAALTMRPLDQGSREIARNIDAALQALSSQLDALLDVSKLDAGVVPVREAEFSIARMLRRLQEEFEPAAKRKGLQLTLACPPSANVYSDQLLLLRVVRNLLDNAIKYTASGAITLTLEPAGTSCRLRVRDTGPGIPIDEQARVFEEFYQLGNPERDRTQGLGLGLSIVKRLCELLDLNLTMHSVPGEGTEFELQLTSALALAQLPEDLASAAIDIKGLHVLVVDDEEAVRRAMQTLLDGIGCRSSLAAGTASALEAARIARPDIVLADLRLQGNDDGIVAVRELRRLHPGIPALLISGDTAPERLRDAHTAGLRLLHKPVAVGALTRAIREEVDSNGRNHGGDAGR